MAHVPAGNGVTKAGESFTYGDYDVTLIECKLDGNVYATGADQEHGGTLAHKSAKLAASAK